MSPLAGITISALFAAGALCLSGCERKKKVIEIETPAGSLEVNQDKDTGGIEIKASEKKN